MSDSVFAGAGDARVSMPWALRDYAFLADGERGTVVGPKGEMVWLCAPSWGSDAVFSALIGGSGEYVVRPRDDWHVWGGYYEDGTLIRVNRWVGTGFIIECREALAAPAAPERLVVLRRIRAVQGTAGVEVLLDPRPGFGRHAMDLHREAGFWCAAGSGLELRWDCPVNAWATAGGLRASISLPEGEELDLVLELRVSGAGDRDDLHSDRLWEATQRWWGERVPAPSGLPADGDVRHAYAVLNGLTSVRGGMAAAATTSLPERADTGRNYDYRYAWLRDQAYAGIAVAAHGPHPLLEGAVNFAAARVLEDGPALRPVYTVDGGRVPEEHRLPLPGYPGGSDRVGNRAAEQFQLDSYGEVLQLFAAAARLDRLDTDARRAVDIAVGAVESNWLRPDSGVWELEPRWWTHSRLAVVCGLRALAGAVAGPSARRWSELADAVESETRRRCLRTDGAWGRAEDDRRPDAALLVPLARGLLPGDDPSGARTRALIENELTRDGFVYRFRRDGRRLGEAEGAFLMCGFLMAMAVDREGDRVGACRWFERTRSAYGPARLFAEEYDVGQRQLRGNLPQAFVHAALLESAAALGVG